MLENIIILASFIPIIIGMGGNIGTQSSTIIVRGMATGRINIGNELMIIVKELKNWLNLGFVIRLMLGIFGSFRFLDPEPVDWNCRGFEHLLINGNCYWSRNINAFNFKKIRLLTLQLLRALLLRQV